MTKTKATSSSTKETDRSIVKQNGCSTKMSKAKEFIPPDGGWGWVIVVAAGLNNLLVFTTIQQFGLLFRAEFVSIGMSSAQLTSVLNMSFATISCIGLANGPIFRRFTYRQVAITGSMFCFIALFMASFSNTFTMYVISLSGLFGTGIGLLMAANSIALNTYFKKRRRTATSLTWTATGLGPIIMPFIIIELLAQYNTHGAVLIISGMALNTIPLSMLLQPVEWHSKKQDVEQNGVQKQNGDEKQNGGDKQNGDEKQNGNEKQNGGDDNACNSNTSKRKESVNYFGSQHSMAGSMNYTYNEDDPNCPGYEISEPVSILTKSNVHINESNGGVEGTRKRTVSDGGLESDYKITNDRRMSEANILKSNDTYKSEEIEPLNAPEIPEDKKELTLGEKIVEFLDLDLLKDPVFINISLGLTMVNFNEMNFSTLTPVILHDFGLDSNTIGLFMSALGGIDVASRLCIPLIAAKIKLDNRSFYLVGVLLTALGRIVLSQSQSKISLIAVMIIIGIGKSFRTIFNALVIPSYVTLERLPGASGLMLVISGIFTLVCGPILGYLKDLTSASMTLHILNVTTFLTTITWTLEKIIRRSKGDIDIEH